MRQKRQQKYSFPVSRASVKVGCYIVTSVPTDILGAIYVSDIGHNWGCFKKKLMTLKVKPRLHF